MMNQVPVTSSGTAPTPEILKAWELAAGDQRVSDLFVASFGYSPEGAWSAPGRVNLIGEHTDYNGGLVLPIALPHRTYVAVSRRKDRVLRLVSAQESGVRELSLDQIGPVGSDQEVPGWPAYLAGVIYELEQDGLGPLPGFDIAVDSCVPFGAGLSSSAALECAVAVAVDELSALGLAGTISNPNDAGRSRLVTACILAENEIAGAPTGGMDQAAALRSRAGYALELDCRDASVQQVPFDLTAAGLELLVIDTRAPHALVDGQYAARRNTCEAAAKVLGVKLLADLDDAAAAVAKLSDPTAQARVRHVITEIARVREVVKILQAGDISAAAATEIGKQFAASHISMRDDYQISCPELDLAVDTAVAAGAYGARMTGGGFGGSAIALISADQSEATIAAIFKAFAEAGFNRPQFLNAIASAPAGAA